MNDLVNVVKNTKILLEEDQEWLNRYDNYANEIHANIQYIKDAKSRFRKWEPLCLYMSVSKTKGATQTKVSFDLRYLGQSVADLVVKNRKPELIISEKKAELNLRDFNCTVSSGKMDWDSNDAKSFRKHFRSYPLRNNADNNKGNEEHRCESMLLTEFSKKSTIIKHQKLPFIQPVLIGGIARFQMPTPLKASNVAKGITYSSQNGGGIDILTRTGLGRGTKLCIMEVKDENVLKEPPEKAIAQGLAYATFIRAILRSKSGKKWWEIFGFSGNVPEKLTLNVACVMPSNKNNDYSFANTKIQLDNDIFELHYLYFNEKQNKIKDIVTSINKRKG